MTQHQIKAEMASYIYHCSLTKDELFLLLCVNDSALFFTNRADVILGSNIPFTQMEIMGLTKTEAMFYPSRKTMEIWIEDNNKTCLPSTILPIIDSDAPKNNLRLKR